MMRYSFSIREILPFKEDYLVVFGELFLAATYEMERQS
jgi:hypothetical protein